MVKVVAINDEPEKPKKRFGFMKGQMTIPEGNGFKDDFKDYIEDIFGLNK